jgi:hypothetical protein
MNLNWNDMEFLKLRLIKVGREIGSGGEAKVYEAQVQEKGASVVKVPKWSEGRDDHDDRCLSELLYIKYEPEDFAHLVRKWIDLFFLTVSDCCRCLHCLSCNAMAGYNMGETNALFWREWTALLAII